MDKKGVRGSEPAGRGGKGGGDGIVIVSGSSGSTGTWFWVFFGNQGCFCGRLGVMGVLQV